MNGIMGGKTKPAKQTPTIHSRVLYRFKFRRCYAAWSHIITDFFSFIGSGLVALGKGGRLLFEPNDSLCSCHFGLRSKTFLLSFGGVAGRASLSSSFSSV